MCMIKREKKLKKKKNIVSLTRNGVLRPVAGLRFECRPIFFPFFLALAATATRATREEQDLRWCMLLEPSIGGPW